MLQSAAPMDPALMREMAESWHAVVADLRSFLSSKGLYPNHMAPGQQLPMLSHGEADAVQLRINKVRPLQGQS